MEIHRLEFLDTLIREYKCSGSVNRFNFDHQLISAFQESNLASECKLKDPISDPDESSFLLKNSTTSNLVQSLGVSSDANSPEEHDFTDAILKYISQMLMEEEDLEHKPCMFQDCLALQAAEKSLYDIIGEKYPPSLDSPNDKFTTACSSQSSNSSNAVDYFIEPEPFRDPYKLESPSVDHSFDSILQSFGPSNSFFDVVDAPVNSLAAPSGVRDSFIGSQRVSQFKSGDKKFNQFLQYRDHSKHDLELLGEADKNRRDHSPNGPRGKKNHHREDYVEAGRSNKQLASYAEDSEDSIEQEQMYDKVLLCPRLNPHLFQQESVLCPDNDASHTEPRSKVQQNGTSKGSNVGRPRGKRNSNKKEVVDLRTLLSQCAQAVARADSRSTNDLLNRIRQHSSPYGDGTERLAHYFANALEARLAGTGTALYAACATKRISAADILKGYQVYVKACPFSKMSNLFANKSIGEVAKTATRLHIIDFGILYGFQWPCLIQHLSVRPGGPPKLRITGIELPQPGFRPADRVEETGRRLKKYCERFNVPFEYDAIAKKWDTIKLEDLKIDPEEVLVVNCLYRLRNVPDDTVVVSSPRDAVLNLIKKINPDLFVHGVVNGTYNAPFFVTRFREALFHYSALFDMFEADVPREDQYRMLFEKEVFGRDVMNVIACEGTERVERPETYKQWQVRNMRAGFRQLPLDKETMDGVRDRVRRGYHKDFVVDEDSQWMLQGWKGRIIYAISCWKPSKEF